MTYPQRLAPGETYPIRLGHVFSKRLLDSWGVPIDNREEALAEWYVASYDDRGVITLMPSSPVTQQAEDMS